MEAFHVAMRGGGQHERVVTGRVLGPPELFGPEGTLRPRGSRQGVLLGGLLLHEGEVVPVADLISWLWDHSPPDRAKDALYVHLMRLRKAVRKVSGSLVRIVNENGGYRIDLGTGVADVGEFRALVREGRRFGEEGLLDDAVDRLAKAELLWRGDVLEGLPAGHLLQERAVHLREEWGRAAELRNDLETVLGRHGDLIPRLRSLVSRHPSRERFWWQLMYSLYGDGRQVEALECYREARTLLREEYGLEPGAELDLLHRQILEHEVPAGTTRMVARRRLGEADPADDAWTVQRQLPPEQPGLVGRRRETELMEGLLLRGGSGRTPVVVVSGPPGIGKSALAIRVGHLIQEHYPDGQWHVGPSHGQAGHGAANRLGDLLLLSGVHPHRIPGGGEARAAALRARLAGRRVLIIVDGVTSSDDVLSLLPSAPGCAVIVTSLFQFTDLSGADRVRLAPLTPTQSERLLANQVGQARVTREADAALEIAALCCGNPLALSAVGARLARRPDAGLTGFAERLRDRRRRVAELSAGVHRVGDAMESAYLALPSEIRDAFLMLGLVGVDEYTSWALAALLGSDDAEESIEALVEASVLVPMGVDRAGEPRYRVHGLLQLYAESLAEGEPGGKEIAAIAVRRLIDAFMQIGQASLRQRPRVVWGRLSGPADNAGNVLSPETVARLVRVPLGWEQSEWRLAVALVDRACALGLHTEAARLSMMVCVPPNAAAERMYETVYRAACDAGDRLTAARMEFVQARHLVYRRPQLILERLQECLAVFRELGALSEQFHTLVWLSITGSAAGLDQEARGYALQALNLASELDEWSLGASAVPEFALALSTPPRDPGLVSAFTRAWRSAEALGDAGLQWTVLHWFSGAADKAGYPGEALWAAKEGLRLCASSNESQAVAAMLVRLARVHLTRGETTEAEVAAERAWRVLAMDGDEDGIAVACELFSELLEAGIRLPADAA